MKYNADNYQKYASRSREAYEELKELYQNTLKPLEQMKIRGLLKKYYSDLVCIAGDDVVFSSYPDDGEETTNKKPENEASNDTIDTNIQKIEVTDKELLELQENLNGLIEEIKSL